MEEIKLRCARGVKAELRPQEALWLVKALHPQLSDYHVLSMSQDQLCYLISQEVVVAVLAELCGRQQGRDRERTAVIAAVLTGHPYQTLMQLPQGYLCQMLGQVLEGRKATTTKRGGVMSAVKSLPWGTLGKLAIPILAATLLPGAGGLASAALSALGNAAFPATTAGPVGVTDAIQAAINDPMVQQIATKVATDPLAQQVLRNTATNAAMAAKSMASAYGPSLSAAAPYAVAGGALTAQAAAAAAKVQSDREMYGRVVSDAERKMGFYHKEVRPDAAFIGPLPEPARTYDNASYLDYPMIYLDNKVKSWFGRG
eukprot:jgi/Mesvir1/11139/Mv04581-RA.1